MGTEGPHASAHHSPLAAGIVVGDFKSKRRRSSTAEKKTRIPGTIVEELIFQQKMSGN